MYSLYGWTDIPINSMCRESHAFSWIPSTGKCLWLIDVRQFSVPCMYSGNALESTLHIQDYTLYVELLHPELKKKKNTGSWSKYFSNIWWIFLQFYKALHSHCKIQMSYKHPYYKHQCVPHKLVPLFLITEYRQISNLYVTSNPLVILI